MKKRFLSIFLALCMVLTVMPSNALATETVESGVCGTDLTWILDADGILTIRGTGEMFDYDYTAASKKSPWDSNSDVKSIVIENGVSTIGASAFYGCRSLTQVNIPNSVSRIGGYSFQGCRNLASIYLPNGLTQISTYAFANTGLISVDIPEGVSFIAPGAFYLCSSLTSVNLPDSVTSIGYYAFMGCGNLSDVNMPNSVKSIGYDAFHSTKLSSVCIPENVTTIDRGVFADCYNLTSVTIPVKVSEILSGAFRDCRNLSDVYYAGSKEQWELITIGDNNQYLKSATIHYNSLGNITNESIFVGTWEIDAEKTMAVNGESMTSIFGHDYGKYGSEMKINADHTFTYGIAVGIGGEGDWRFDGSQIIYDIITYEEGQNESGTLQIENRGEDEYYLVMPYFAYQIYWKKVGGNPDPSNEITFRSDDDFTVYIDGTSIILADIPNASNLQKSDIMWSSSDDSVVTIESNNALIEGNFASATAVIRGVSFGTATITVTLSDGRSSNCQIEVIAVPNTIQLSYISSLPINASQSLSAQIKFNTIVAGDEIVWTSSDGNIVAFDTNGSTSVNHPLPTIPSDSIAIDFVTLYGRGTGKVKITCRMPASGVEASVDILVYTDKTDNLKKLAADWQTAYKKYGKAVLDALNQHKNDTVSGVELSDDAIQKAAEKLKKTDDSNKNDKLVNFDAKYENNPEVSEHVYRAVAEFLAETTAQKFAVGAIDVSSGDMIKISSSIVNLLHRSIDVETYEYQYDNIKILIGGFSGLDAHERSISYKVGSSRSVMVATLISTKGQMDDVIKDYVDELLKLEKSAVKEAWHQLKKEIFDLGLDSLTKAKISEKLGKYTRVFEQTKVGKVITTLETCVDYWKYVKKIVNLSNADPMQLVTDLPTMETFTFTSDSISDKTVNTAMKGINDAKDKLEDAIAQYLLTGNIDVIDVVTQWGKDTLSGAKSEFMCPVNIAVYDSAGTQIGYVGEDDIWYSGDTVYIEKYGDSKTIYSNGIPLRFEITATDEGMLNCTFEEYADGIALSRVNYYDISLHEGKSILASVPKETLTTDTVIVTTGDTENISADEYITATDYKTSTVDITGIVNETSGGQVYGSGQYVRGDAVTMLAMAASGYAFLGWQNGDGALESISSVYEFTAREDVMLTALFAPNVDIENIPTYTITFDANGGTVPSATMTTGEDGKLAELPTPVRSGYIFNGWFTALVGGDQVTVNTVFTSDATVYAQWTYNSGIHGGNNWYPPVDSSASTTYRITVPAVSGGTVNVSPTSAKKGNTVTITVVPNDGYVLDNLSAVDRKGNELELANKGDRKYTFVMPDSEVTVKATFQLIEDQVEPQTPWRNPFVDVTANAWYYDAVKFVSDNGLMNGISGTAFAPDANLSRAQLAQILYNKEGKPTVNSTSGFTDVAANDWYADAVVWAATRNIVSGYGNGMFGPNDNITREQLAVMLWRYAGEPAATSKELRFNDAGEISVYALDALRWSVENGIINGKSGGILDPKGLATRAQVAQMLKNFLEK